MHDSAPNRVWFQMAAGFEQVSCSRKDCCRWHLQLQRAGRKDRNAATSHVDLEVELDQRSAQVRKSSRARVK